MSIQAAWRRHMMQLQPAGQPVAGLLPCTMFHTSAPAWKTTILIGSCSACSTTMISGPLLVKPRLAEAIARKVQPFWPAATKHCADNAPPKRRDLIAIARTGMKSEISSLLHDIRPTQKETHGKQQVAPSMRRARMESLDTSSTRASICAKWSAPMGLPWLLSTPVRPAAAIVSRRWKIFWCSERVRFSASKTAPPRAPGSLSLLEWPGCYISTHII